MKLLPISLLCFFSLALAAQSDTTVTSDEEKIKAVIYAETEGFRTKPYGEVVPLYWVLDEKAFICFSDGEGNLHK
jgi:hypothetical protein